MAQTRIKSQLMSASEIDRTLVRLAHEILEKTKDLDQLAFIGIRRRGVPLAQRLAARIETGMVFVNHPTWTAPELPFGGIKNSGYGRELSSLGIQEFVNKKLVCVVPINAPA